MTVSREQVSYLRTMILEDYDENERWGTELDKHGWDGFPILLASVFHLSVMRRLLGRLDHKEVIRLVADMRSRIPEGEPDVPAEAAEALIRAALDPSAEFAVEPRLAGRIQALAIITILQEEGMAGEELDAFLGDAADLADDFT